MLNAIRLYLRYVGISIRAQMQYRASFAMLSVGNLLASLIGFVGLWALFARFSSLRDWQFAEVALFYGMVNVAFAIAEAMARGFDMFPGRIKSGEFDRVLLRPRSTALQIAAQEVQILRVGRFAQGLAVLLWGAWKLELALDGGRGGLACGSDGWRGVSVFGAVRLAGDHGVLDDRVD